MSALTTDNSETGIIAKLRQDHEVLASTGLYLVMATIAYFWFQGKISRWYYIESIVVVIGLSTAALLFIPLFISVVSKSEYEVQAAEATARSSTFE